MNLLALVALLAPFVVAVVLLRQYRNSFQPKRRSNLDSSARWNEVMLEARKLKAAQAGLPKTEPAVTTQAVPDSKPLP